MNTNLSLICEQCGQKLNEKTIRHLYYIRSEDRYTENETDESFPFGKICAEKVLRNGVVM